MGKKESYEDEEMTVELELEDGTVVNCAIITILTVEAKDYIVLLPLDEDGENEDGEVWFYGYSENPDDPNEEPILAYIEDDDVYEKVADAFDEYLDSCEFDHVWIPDCNEKTFPHGSSREPEHCEEERRIFYVAMTRAKKDLELLCLTGTAERPRFPSRFLIPLNRYHR